MGEQTPYIHPDSPATGVQWMATPAIAFDRLKLTNNRTREAQGQVSLVLDSLFSLSLSFSIFVSGI